MPHEDFFPAALFTCPGANACRACFFSLCWKTALSSILENQGRICRNLLSEKRWMKRKQKPETKEIHQECRKKKGNWR